MKNQNKRSAGSLLALLLLCVFAVCILLVLTTGANDYRRLTERDSRSFDRRTAVQYLSTKLRQADAAGAVRLVTFEGCDALELTDTSNADYITRIYCSDGYLRELFSARENTLSPADGEPVLPAQALTVEAVDEHTLLLHLTDSEGADAALVLTLRSESEAQP